MTHAMPMANSQYSVTLHRWIKYGVICLMFAILSGLFGCSNLSRKERKFQEQSVIEQLQTKYPNDTFEISKYYTDTDFFPYASKFILNRQDYKEALYIISSNKFDEEFRTYFEWNDEWNKVTVISDKYPYVLLRQAQEHLLPTIASQDYATKFVPKIKYIGVDNAVLELRDLDDAIDYLKHPEDFMLKNIVLVTIPNASGLDTINAIYKDITKKTEALSPNMRVVEVRFYSQDQVDVSQVEFQNKLSITQDKHIREMEKEYDIIEPYYIINKRERTMGQRFGR